MLAVEGAQVLLNSLNSFALDEASLHVPVRAVENKVWVVAANKVGPLVPDRSIDDGGRAGRRAERAAARRGGEPDRRARRHRRRGRARAPVRPSSSPTSTSARADDKRRPDGTDVMGSRRPELYDAIVAPPVGRSRRARRRRAVTRGRVPGDGDDVHSLTPGRRARRRRAARRAARARRRTRSTTIVAARRRHRTPWSSPASLEDGAHIGWSSSAPTVSCSGSRSCTPVPGTRGAVTELGDGLEVLSTCRGGGWPWWSATTRSIPRPSGWRRCRTPTSWPSRSRTATDQDLDPLLLERAAENRLNLAVAVPHERRTAPGCSSRCRPTSRCGPPTAVRSTA